MVIVSTLEAPYCLPGTALGSTHLFGKVASSRDALAKVVIVLSQPEVVSAAGVDGWKERGGKGEVRWLGKRHNSTI